MLSAAAFGGASRSGKHFSRSGARAIPVGIHLDGNSLAGDWLQAERFATRRSGFPNPVLVRSGAHRNHDFPLGMVEVLTRLTPHSSTGFRLEAKGGGNMAFKQGETYRCPDPECGCEVTVTKGAAPGKGGNQSPRCYCGKEMVKK